MAALPDAVANAFVKAIGEKILEIRSIHGGDINDAWKVSTRHNHYFVKVNNSAQAHQMLSTELKGLELLSASQVISTPTPLTCEEAGGYSFLVLPYIEEGIKNNIFWDSFGQQLAQLHQQTQEQYGLHFNNFIGWLPQSNTLHTSWVDFYIQERLAPQLKMARDKGLISEKLVNTFELFFQKLYGLLPDESPALLHGDLWSGNFLASAEGLPVLIDPAPYYGHREVDLAMTRLFGGFSPTFYQSYQYSFPLLPGFEQRVSLYQLYYLMVHVNLFGESYLSSVLQIVRKYG